MVITKFSETVVSAGQKKQMLTLLYIQNHQLTEIMIPTKSCLQTSHSDNFFSRNYTFYNNVNTVNSVSSLSHAFINVQVIRDGKPLH